MGQVFAADFGFCQVFHMRFNGDVHEALLIMFARDGIHSFYNCDKMKGMINEKIHQKLPEMSCCLKLFEPYTSWLNGTKKGKGIQEGCRQKLIMLKVPKLLLIDCLVFESYVESSTKHEINKLDKEVPE